MRGYVPTIASEFEERAMADEIQHGDGQMDAVKGHGVEPADLGYAPPDPGLGESAESEIPTGVDSLTDEQIQKAQENAPSGDEGDGGEGGGGGAIDVAAIMEDGGADASGDADADASGEADADAAGEADADAAGDADADDADASGDADADASGDADADASGDDETEGNAADDAGEGATEMTEPEAAVAPDTGEA
jgi:hypothetical protein